MIKNHLLKNLLIFLKKHLLVKDVLQFMDLLYMVVKEIFMLFVKIVLKLDNGMII